MRQFSTNVVEGEHNHVVYVAGEIDLATAPALSAVLDDVSRADVPAVRVDLADVDFLDSSGIKALLGLLRLLVEAGRTMVVSRPKPIVTRTIEICGLSDVFNIVDSDTTPESVPSE